MSVPKPPPPRKRHHHGDLRAALVAAALAHVRAEGAASFSLRHASAGAGVTSGAAYRHFASREAVLAEVVVLGFAEMSRAMQDASAGPAGRARLAATGRAYVAFARAEPRLFALMFSPEGAAGRAQALAADLGVPSASAQLAAALQAAGVTSPTAHLRAWGLAHGLAALAAAGTGGTESEQDAAIDNFVEGLASG